MKTIFVFVFIALLGLGTDLTMAAAPGDERAKKFAVGLRFPATTTSTRRRAQPMKPACKNTRRMLWRTSISAMPVGA